MKRIPIFSIIVPIYKTPIPYLEQCIDSILNQTFSDFSLILVDDGSPDDCGVFCDKYASTDSRITVIHKTNEGVAAARNSGLDISNGEWIVFVDPDDWIEPIYLSSFAEYSSRTDAEIILCSTYVNYQYRQDAKPFFKDDYIYARGKDKDRFLLQFLCGNIYRDNLCTADSGSLWAKIYKKSLIDKYNLRFNPKLSRMEDNTFNLYAYERSHSICYVNNYLYHYRKSIHSGFSQFTDNIEHSYELFFQELYRFITEENKPHIFMDAFNIKVLNSIYVYGKMKYFHPRNPQPMRFRLSSFKRLLRNEFYSLPISEINMHYLNRVEVVFYLAARTRSSLILYFLHHCKNLLFRMTGRGL